jgi:uncharacterized integral membrane protein
LTPQEIALAHDPEQPTPSATDRPEEPTEQRAVDQPVDRTADRGPNPLRASRTSGIWLAVVGLGVLLILLIVFIAQNTQRSEVHFFGWDGEAPQAVTLLIAAAAGLLVAVVAASLRILQLRRRVKRAR